MAAITIPSDFRALEEDVIASTFPPYIYHGIMEPDAILTYYLAQNVLTSFY